MYIDDFASYLTNLFYPELILLLYILGLSQFTQVTIRFS